jgi:beta-lactam-binding protein with PASTA domain
MAKGVFREAEEAADSTSVLTAPSAPELPQLTEGIMPDLQGLGARDAVSLVEQLGLRAKILGSGLVSSQDIKADSKVKHGQVVTLTLKANAKAN